MDNILYLDDYINLYNKRTNKLIIVKPYKNTLRNGFIIDRKKFINKFNKIINENKLKGNFFYENIFIIINNLYSKEYKLFIKEIMESLNYKKIIYINELDYLRIDKKHIYINCNYNYFYFLYTNKIGNIQLNIYKNDEINKKIFNNILKILNKDNIILYGKNYKEFINMMNKNINYYYFEKSENLIINLLIKSK